MDLRDADELLAWMRANRVSSASVDGLQLTCELEQPDAGALIELDKPPDEGRVGDTDYFDPDLWPGGVVPAGVKAMLAKPPKATSGEDDMP